MESLHPPRRRHPFRFSETDSDRKLRLPNPQSPSASPSPEAVHSAPALPSGAAYPFVLTTGLPSIVPPPNHQPKAHISNRSFQGTRGASEVFRVFFLLSPISIQIRRFVISMINMVFVSKARPLILDFFTQMDKEPSISHPPPNLSGFPPLYLKRSE